jgi:hypothetical protein
MFLRPHFRRRNGQREAYWALVESCRTERGPRQRTVAYLGLIDEAGRLGVEQAAEPQRASPQRELFLEDKPEPRFVEIDVTRVRVENCRQFGGPWLALELAPALLLYEAIAPHCWFRSTGRWPSDRHRPVHRSPDTTTRFEWSRHPSRNSQHSSQKIGVPILFVLRIVRPLPTTRDRIAQEIDVDASLPSLFQQHLVGRQKNRCGLRSRLIGTIAGKIAGSDVVGSAAGERHGAVQDRQPTYPSCSRAFALQHSIRCSKTNSCHRRPWHDVSVNCSNCRNKKGGEEPRLLAARRL